MASTTVRSSTQDGSAGTPVMAGLNEDGSATLQLVALVGNKTTYAEAVRTAITAADTAVVDLSTVGFAGTSGANLTDCGNALVLTCRASCSVPSGTLTGRVVLYDGSNAPISLSEVVTFTSDGSRRLSAAGDYVVARTLIDAGQARKFRFYVESVSAGTWTVAVRPI